MKSRPTALRPRAGVDVTPETLTLREKFLSILHSDPLINGIVAVAVAVGFLHGWLKIRFPHPATTFVFDALLGLALGLTFFNQKRGTPFIPPGPVGAALKGFYLLCFFYLLLPWRPPLLVSAAAIRGWCFATLMFSLGYRLTRGIAQVKGYFYVLILLGLMTAIYGLRQTPEEVEKQMLADENFAERYQNTYYATSKGRQLRVFSTFISSGAFGGTMAYVTVFAIALLSDPNASRRERLLLTATIGPIAYALVLSGARSALISLAMGFVIIAWYRRNLQNFVLIPTMIVLALRLAAEFTGGSSVERYKSLLNFEEILGRNSVPTMIGWDYVKDNPLGGGLGKSGYSVPFFLGDRAGYRDWVSSDGDLGRLMIEMGFLGLIFFGRVLWASMKTVYGCLKRLQDSPVSTVALASAACFAMAIASFPSGSPFLGIPMGALVWFFLGTLNKLSDEHAKGAFKAGSLAEGPVLTAPQKRFLYYRPTKNLPSGQRRRP